MIQLLKRMRRREALMALLCAVLVVGQVFANAQTGNIVLLSAALLRGDWAVCLRYAIPLLSFVFAVGAGLGSFVTEAADIRAIWVCCGLLLVSFALMFVRDERES